MPDAKAPLISRDLRILLVSMVLANIGTMMLMPLLALYLTSRGASIPQVGLFFTLASIFPLAVQIMGGWLSDSIGRLRAIALGSLAGLAAYVVYLLAATYWWLLLGEALFSIARALVGPSFSAFTAEESEPERRGRTFGTTQSIFLVVNVVGPVLGGWIADNLGFQVMFAVAGSLYMAATVIRLMLARTLPPPAQGPRASLNLSGLKQQLGGLMALVLAGGVVTWILLVDGVRDTSFRMSFELMPVYLEQIGGLTLTQIGGLESVVGLAAMLITPLGGILSDRRGERVAIVLGTITTTAAFAVFLGARRLADFALAWALFGTSWGLMDPAYQSLISKAVPSRLLGTAYGFLDTSLGLVSMPAPWIGAQLWTRIGPQAPFVVTMLANAASVWPIWSRFKVRTSAADPSPAPSP
jgi:MFS family permease